MAGGNSGLGPCVVVVGDPRSEFVRTMVRLACECEIETVPCDDVYAAVVGLAQAAHRRVLVVGRMRELARENGMFFHLVAAQAVPCCCLWDAYGPVGRESMQRALRARVAMVGDPDQMQTILADWLRSAQHRVRPSADTGGLLPAAASFLTIDGDLRATEEELRALLGHPTRG